MRQGQAAAFRLFFSHRRQLQVAKGAGVGFQESEKILFGDQQQTAGLGGFDGRRMNALGKEPGIIEIVARLVRFGLADNAPAIKGLGEQPAGPQRIKGAGYISLVGDHSPFVELELFGYGRQILQFVGFQIGENMQLPQKLGLRCHLALILT